MDTKKKGHTHILFKTKSYLKFNYGLVSAHSAVIDRFSNVTTVNVTTDSIIRYLTVLEPDNYYYYFDSQIPLIEEKNENSEKIIVPIVKDDNSEHIGNSAQYNLRIKSLNDDMYLIISNKKNEKVAVIK